jgi:hypothetical protein
MAGTRAVPATRPLRRDKPASVDMTEVKEFQVWRGKDACFSELARVRGLGSCHLDHRLSDLKMRLFCPFTVEPHNVVTSTAVRLQAVNVLPSEIIFRGFGENQCTQYIRTT